MDSSRYVSVPWRPRNHVVSGAGEPIGALLLGLRRLEAAGAVPAMDPAVLEEMLEFFEQAILGNPGDYFMCASSSAAHHQYMLDVTNGSPSLEVGFATSGWKISKTVSVKCNDNVSRLVVVMAADLRSLAVYGIDRELRCRQLAWSIDDYWNGCGSSPGMMRRLSLRHPVPYVVLIRADAGTTLSLYSL